MSLHARFKELRNKFNPDLIRMPLHRT